MKEFDINKIGKKMPYQAPSEEFFAEFADNIIAKVSTKPKMRLSFTRTLAPILGAAAAIAIIVTASLQSKNNESDKLNINTNFSSNFDKNLDSYLASLSDEELSYLAAESDYNDDFYSNLPNN